MYVVAVTHTGLVTCSFSGGGGGKAVMHTGLARNNFSAVASGEP